MNGKSLLFDPHGDAEAGSLPNSYPYTIIGLDREVCQGEIISNIAQYSYFPTSNRSDELYHTYVVVASQDCDIAQDFSKGDNDKDMNGILLYEAQLAGPFFERNSIKGDHKQGIRQNRDDRYHRLYRCCEKFDLVGEGFDDLIIDFKRYFTIPPSELYRQVTSMHGARRRTRLNSPFKEHLQNRIAFYLQRVALPDQNARQQDGPANALPVGATQDAPGQG